MLFLEQEVERAMLAPERDHKPEGVWDANAVACGPVARTIYITIVH